MVNHVRRLDCQSLSDLVKAGQHKVGSHQSGLCPNLVIADLGEMGGIIMMRGREEIPLKGRGDGVKGREGMGLKGRGGGRIGLEGEGGEIRGRGVMGLKG